jgi:hypothetical protein
MRLYVDVEGRTIYKRLKVSCLFISHLIFLFDKDYDVEVVKVKVNMKITRYANETRTALFHRATTTSKKPHFDSFHKIQRTRNCSSLYESITPKTPSSHAQSPGPSVTKARTHVNNNNTTATYPRSRPKPFHPTTYLPHPRALQQPKPSHPHNTSTATMRRNHVLVLILFLTAFFCIFFGWALYKFCRRSIDAKFHEMQYQRDIEASKSRSGKSGSSKKTESKKGDGSKQGDVAW